MRQCSASLRELFASAWRNRALIFALARREVIGRYRGSVIGILWSFFHPLLMLVIYTFVFGVVFKSRWGTGTESRAEFALILFSGLLVFNFFSECVNRAPGLILANVNYVKKVVFPLEVLPWVAICSALFHTLVSFGVWLLFYLGLFGVPPSTLVLFPVVLVPLILLTIGASWLLASLGVFLRDVAQVIGIVTTAMMFLSPIFYPLSALPTEYRSVLQVNPLTLVIEQVRDVLIWGKTPDWRVLIGYIAIALFFAWVGFAWFQRTRKGFADVL